jgi:hypothetical protein
MKKCMMIVMALVVLLLNPLMFASGCSGFRCGEDLPEPEYSEQDVMRELRAIPRLQSVTLDSGEVVDVSFFIDEGSFASVQRHLWRRALAPDWVQSVQACSVSIGRRVVIDGTVTVTLTSRDGTRDMLLTNEPIRGYYAVESEQLNTGELSIEPGSGSELGSRELSLRYATLDGRGVNARLETFELDVVFADGHSDRLTYRAH